MQNPTQNPEQKAPRRPAQSGKIITVFGGSGFVGRHLVRALVREGWRVRVAVRRPNAALFLKTFGAVGQVALMPVNICDAKSCQRVLRGADAAVNLVGILAQSRRQRFDAVQAQGAGQLARLAAEEGVAQFVHVSAIGAAPDSASAYARSKFAGEQGVLKAFKSAVVLRPSLIVGAGDGFFTRFARMAAWSPFLPLIGGGRTLFQPVSVGDVAAAVQVVLRGGAIGGKIYELGGGQIYSFKELLQFMLSVTGRKCLLLPCPFWAAKIIGRAAQILPNPILTADQVALLEQDNVVSQAAEQSGQTLAGLGIAPEAIEAVVAPCLQHLRAPR